MVSLRLTCVPLALVTASLAFPPPVALAFQYRQTPFPPRVRVRRARTDLRSTLPPSEANSAAAADALSRGLERGLERMDRIMTEDFFLATPSLRRMRTTIAKSVAIRPSSIAGAGDGLFATKNLRAGTVVSFYPAHCLGAELGGGEVWATSNGDREYFAQNNHASSVFLHATDQPVFGRPSVLEAAGAGEAMSKVAVYLDVNPNRDVDSAWVSQYINDGATIEKGTAEGVTGYYRESKARKNCIHAPFGPSPIMATVATRKIKKGEELFTSYGCVYWLGALETKGGLEDAPGMTGLIQSQIRESAEDLFRCMKSVKTTYGTEIDVLEAAIGSSLK